MPSRLLGVLLADCEEMEDLMEVIQHSKCPCCGEFNCMEMKYDYDPLLADFTAFFRSNCGYSKDFYVSPESQIHLHWKQLTMEQT